MARLTLRFRSRKQRGLALVIASATILVSLLVRDLQYANRRSR
jgi:hypothetical protein